MSGFLLPALYGLSGICVYAALHHGLIAFRRPVERTHLWFALSCLGVALYIIAKASAYQADSAQALVAMRRWEISFAMVFLAILPWFVAEYTTLRPRWLLAGVSVFFTAVFAANLVLPYGLGFVELPDFQHVTLPWGEQVADLRVHRRGGWFIAAWLGLLLVFAYSILACVRQYRRGAYRRALTLALALGLFLAFVLFNQVVNFGLVNFIHTAEFGFIALVLIMSLSLTRELREREWRMRAVLDNVQALVYMKDQNGRYLMINRRYEEQFHVTNAAVAGKTDYELFPAPQAEAHRANDRRVVEDRRPLEFEEVADKDGNPRTYVSLKFPLLDQDRIPYAVCGVSTDVTESRKAEQELHSLRRQVWLADRVARTGLLSASIAHELNQPLAAILSNAQAALRFLVRDKPDLQEIREILEDIVRDDKRAGMVITGLRGMLRQQETERTGIDISETLHEMLGPLRSELIGRQVEVSTDFAPDCVVRADKGQIQQVVLNLVMNGVEAMGEQPEATRRLQLVVAPTPDGTVRTAVRDSGMGIPKDGINKVFEAFHTTKPLGMGMGLAVSRSIVESHGGTIWVEPNEDHGVTFYFTLPRDATSAAAA